MSPSACEPQSNYSREVNARFADFVNPKTPWPRRLWDVSPIFSLEELHESGNWVDRKALGESAVSWLRHRQLQILLAHDLAWSDPALKREIQECLKSDLGIRSERRRALRVLIDETREEYLRKWADGLAQKESEGRAPANYVAQVAASHLLDSGHSLVGLRRWLKEQGTLSAVDLMTAAHELSKSGLTEFVFWVPVLRVPRFAEKSLDRSVFQTWPDMPQLVHEEWLRHDPNSLPRGALKISITARDEGAAVARCADVLERMHTRFRLAASSGHLQIASHAVLDPDLRTVEIASRSREASVLSLQAEGELFSVAAQQDENAEKWAIDDALELTSHMNYGSPASALTGMWAALESLLANADDSKKGNVGRVVAAGRAGSLVACSWPRAELTALSYQIDEQKPAGRMLNEKLGECSSNRDRAIVIATAIANEGGVPLKRTWRLDSDIAAVYRMKEFLAEPKKQLQRQRDNAESAIRRLYRCRNIVVHGGATSGALLEATVRLATPLVGAALDRIVHSHHNSTGGPLELAARAGFRINTINGDTTVENLVDLLE